MGPPGSLTISGPFPLAVACSNPEIRSTLCSLPVCPLPDRLVGLVVKASASRAEDPGFKSRLRRDFFGVESYL